MAATKAQLRDQIADLGGPPPPKSATRAELAAVAAALVGPVPESDDLPAAAPSHSVPVVQPVRCAAGRPLLTDTQCRHCFIQGQTVCEVDR